NIHRCSSSPRSPSGVSRLWRGPATNPSTEIVMLHITLPVRFDGPSAPPASDVPVSSITASVPYRQTSRVPRTPDEPLLVLGRHKGFTGGPESEGGGAVSGKYRTLLRCCNLLNPRSEVAACRSA